MQSGARIRIKGQVQGVGFRPFIWKLAQLHNIKGTVCNDSEGVLIDAFGENLEDFFAAIPLNAPDIAQISDISSIPISFRKVNDFVIAKSRMGIANTRVAPDMASCADCLREIAQADERRYAYPFTNCTNCGPRYSIVETLPYDRGQTVMKDFRLCEYCESQYHNPVDRRFHAQPIACPQCGPIVDYHGVTGQEAIRIAITDLQKGLILAIKGIGGYHLAVDACNIQAIEKLRMRKNRPSKPFALMMREAELSDYLFIEEGVLPALKDISAPIVLCNHKGVLPNILAPNQKRLGVMLPHTPLHHILMNKMQSPLVMTSANLSGDPPVAENEEAFIALEGVADKFLTHNRRIARRIDDSLVQIFAGETVLNRRARGFVPQTSALPPGFEEAPHIVGFGAEQKSTLCFIKNGEALVGHHLGDLKNWETIEAYESAYFDYLALFDHEPQIGAVDWHIDFASTRFAQSLNIPLEPVQHHHAHMAAVMGEYLLPRDCEPVLAVIFDGFGVGDNNQAWGGEVFLGNYVSFKRLAHLAPAPLIGGDLAQNEPYRNALMRLDAAGLSSIADELFAKKPLNALREARKNNVNCPNSTAMGRLFDAFAAAMEIAPNAQSYEGEAAMILQAYAESYDNHAKIIPYEYGFDNNVFDPSPLFHDWARSRVYEEKTLQAARFHQTLIEAFSSKIRHFATQYSVQKILLTGGVFQNLYLLEGMIGALKGYEVLYPKRYPANDGGIAFGQALIAAARAVEAGK